MQSSKGSKKIIERNLPCLRVIECGSSDARQVYEDGTSFCFSCNKFFNKETTDSGVVPVVDKLTSNSKITIEEIQGFQVRGVQERGITKEIAELYDMRVSYDGEGKINAHFYPYVVGENLSYKVRKLPKEFYTIGTFEGLYGMDKFQGGGQRIVLTEGELDAMAVQQANKDHYNKFYPVVSVPSASQVGINQLLASREWLRTFEEVILLFDNDSAGKEFTQQAIRIIGYDKVKVGKMPLKDPCEMYLKKGAKALLQCIWDAERFVPSGIVEKEALWNALVEYNNTPSTPYAPCLAGVNKKTKGRRNGQITLFISGTGAGKSTLLREDMLHILQTTDEKIGVVSLEESPAETARSLSGMQLNKNPADEEIPLDVLKEGFDKVFGDDRVLLLDHQGSIDDSSIIDKLEYMVLKGCTKLYLDHITILVSEGAEGLQGNEAQDKVMNDLLKLVKRHDIWLGLVSHLRKTPGGSISFEQGRLPSLDDIKGSGSIKQISADVIAFARDMNNESETTRNEIKMAVLKCRFTGLTGPVQGAYYDFKSGRLRASNVESGFEVQPGETTVVENPEKKF